MNLYEWSLVKRSMHCIQTRYEAIYQLIVADGDRWCVASARKWGYVTHTVMIPVKVTTIIFYPSLYKLHHITSVTRYCSSSFGSFMIHGYPTDLTYICTLDTPCNSCFTILRIWLTFVRQYRTRPQDTPCNSSMAILRIWNIQINVHL